MRPNLNLRTIQKKDFQSDHEVLSLLQIKDAFASYHIHYKFFDYNPSLDLTKQAF